MASPGAGVHLGAAGVGGIKAKAPTRAAAKERVKLAGTANLRPCEHQVAGHLFEEGKAGSLVDDRGHFYKPIQPGPRGDRERAFYEAIRAARAADKAAWAAGEWSPAAIAAVQAIAAGNQISEVLFGRAAAAAPAPPRSPAPRSPRRARASGSIAVPRLNGGLPHFPTFRAENSFREGGSAGGGAALAARDPMEVLERDELGLIDEVVVEELLQWSDEEGGSECAAGASPPPGIAASDEGLSRSPDSVSDDGGEMMTGIHVMDGVREAHSMSLRGSGAVGVAAAPPPNENGGLGGLSAALAAVADAAAANGHTVTTATTEAEEAAPGGEAPAAPRPARHSSAEDAQAAAMLGQTAWDAWGGDAEAETDQFDALDGRLRDPSPANGGAAPFGRPLGARRGTTASAMSTDSIEEALRLHSLALGAKEREAGGGGAAPAAPAAASPPPSPPRRAPSPSSALAAWAALPFTVRHAPLLRVIPKFYGVTAADGRVLLELEDLARWYRHPCIMDIKVGYRTWYPAADAAYIERCRRKDAATTQATLGFKICGMQVYRHARGGYWRASKRWCKTLPEALVDKALTSFAHNEQGLRPADVYGGPGGVVGQLRDLEAWFAAQREFRLYSASLLVLYEGDAADAAGAHVRVRLVDFAHTFVGGDGAGGCGGPGGGSGGEAGVDDNFLGGLRAVATRLTAVARLDVADTLMAARVDAADHSHHHMHF